MRGVRVFIGILLIGSAVSAAETSMTRALLPVKVNEISHGEVLALIEPGDVFVPSSLFVELGVPTAGAAKQRVDGEQYLSLRSLAPQVTFNLDMNDLLLRITVEPSLLGRHVLNLQRSALAEDDRGGDSSIFLNYALSGTDLKSAGVFTEVGASRGNSLLYTGLSRTAGRIVRGLTNFNIDSPRQLRRITAGDAVIGQDPLGGTVMIGGLTVWRQFSLRPYLLLSPALDIKGTAVTPSTVEVYVNGQMTSRVQVEPGAFTLNDIPATGGLGSTRVVVRDVFGRESVQEGSFYYSLTALRKGLSDYTFSAGAIRNDLARSFGYDQPAAYAFYRRGVTDTLTLGGRLESSRDLFSGGPRLTLTTPVGDFDAALAASGSHGQSGTAGSIAYRFTTRRYSFGFSGLERSDHYATLSLDRAADRPLQDWTVFAGASMGGVSLGVSGSRMETRDGPRVQRVAVQANASVGRWGAAFASIGAVERDNRRQPEAFLGLIFGIGGGSTVNVQWQRTEGRSGIHAEASRYVGASNGFGYSLRTDTITDQQLALLEYQTSFGRYELSADPRRLGDLSATASGGLVYIGGTFIPSRAIQQGYALARVGVPHVPVFASNQEVGRTNGAGDLLITNLLGHYANLLRIRDADVPLEYQVDKTELTVVPPSRGGVVATFPVKPLRSYTGSMQLMIIGKPFVPSLGSVELQSGGDTVDIPLGRSGEFYIDNLSPGHYPAELQIGKVRCKFELVIPRTNSSLTNLGVLPCVP